MGASAGGVEALAAVVRGLPADLPAAVFVVLHVPPHGASVMPAILNRANTLAADHPKDNDPIVPGRIYVAPPDHHLLVKENYVRVVRGPSENGHRPAVDPLFRSAARAYGPRVVGVILTGTLDDGTAGLAAVKRRGGVAVVQHPDDATFSGMPRSAVENVAVDWTPPLADIPEILVRLVHTPVSLGQTPLPQKQEGNTPVPDDRSNLVNGEDVDLDYEADIAEIDVNALNRAAPPGVPSHFSCPECGGVLMEIKDTAYLIRFRCRTGHAYSPDTLVAEQSAALEEALWTALRALEESAVLSRRLTQRSLQNGHALAAERFASQARDNELRAAIVRQALLREQATATLQPFVAEGNANRAAPYPPPGNGEAFPPLLDGVNSVGKPA